VLASSQLLLDRAELQDLELDTSSTSATKRLAEESERELVADETRPQKRRKIDAKGVLTLVADEPPVTSTSQAFALPLP
jgi:hypothetical protein